MATSGDDADEAMMNTTAAPAQNDTTEYVLLDWLSTNEITDIMWSLALHGRADDLEKDKEISLSETADALSDVVFDRISDFLRQDLDTMEPASSAPWEKDTESAVKEQEEHNAASNPSVETIRTDSFEVEVVGAALIRAKAYDSCRTGKHCCWPNLFRTGRRRPRVRGC